MSQESHSPIEQRSLIIFGKAAQKAVDFVKNALPRPISTNTLILFVDYSPADFPIGKVFTKVFKKDAAANYEDTHCKVIAVTQEFAKSFDQIPSGWKTICAFEFSSEIPSLIQNLPEIDGWSEGYEFRICLSDDETWQALSKA